jgi:Stress responsive A/B Barrel Domain
MAALTPDLLAAVEQRPGRKFPLVDAVVIPSFMPRVIVSLQMIRHIVMWKLRGPSQEEKRQQAEKARTALLSMLGKVPGLLQMEVGIGSVSSEQEADLVLSSTHDSWEALKAYATHPAHEPVKQLIGELRTERRVLDFEA